MKPSLITNVSNLIPNLPEDIKETAVSPGEMGLLVIPDRLEIPDLKALTCGVLVVIEVQKDQRLTFDLKLFYPS